MITEITGKNFKGLEFTQPIGEKTMFIGPNGAGKTARTQALTLATIGYIPAGGHKKPVDILNNYSDGEKLSVGFRLDKIEFVRRVSKNKKGVVSQDYLLDGRKTNKDGFIEAMTKAGLPKILDLGEFLSMSDQKKIDRVFELFPPSDDIAKLDAQIEQLNDKINAKHADIRDGEKLIGKLTKAKVDIELPHGTLAELQSKIDDAKSQYKIAAKNLENARIEKAQAEAKAQAEEEAKKKAAETANARFEKLIADKQKTEEGESTKEEKTAPLEQKPLITPEAKAAEDRLKKRAEKLGQGEFKKPEVPDTFVPKELATGSIQLIINTMNMVGCQACTAAMVAKRELRRFQLCQE